MPPNSADEVGKAPGGGDCLRLEPSPTTELKGGFQRVPERLSLPQTASRSGFGGAPTLHPRRLVAVTPISGPRACLLRRRRAWARALGARTAPGKKHLLCTEPGKLSPSLLAFMAADRGVPGCGAAGSTWCQSTFPFIFPHPQPSFSQLCAAGRTDVRQPPLPLPRGRWPGWAGPPQT